MQGDKIKALIGKYINQLGKDKLVEEALQELDTILKPKKSIKEFTKLVFKSVEHDEDNEDCICNECEMKRFKEYDSFYELGKAVKFLYINGFLLSKQHICLLNTDEIVDYFREVK